MIDQSYPVIHLRKDINHVMFLFVIWCETLIGYWDQMQRLKLLLSVFYFSEGTQKGCVQQKQ